METPWKPRPEDGEEIRSIRAAGSHDFQARNGDSPVYASIRRAVLYLERDGRYGLANYQAYRAASHTPNYDRQGTKGAESEGNRATRNLRV